MRGLQSATDTRLETKVYRISSLDGTWTCGTQSPDLVAFAGHDPGPMGMPGASLKERKGAGDVGFGYGSGPKLLRISQLASIRSMGTMAF